MNVETFKAIRYFKNMNQEEFSKWIGVSTPVVALFEAGHRPLSDVTRAKLARKFDVSNPEFIEYKRRIKNLKKGV